MKRKKEKKLWGLRVANAICAATGVLTGSLLVLGVTVYVFARATIRPERDEALFAAAGQSTVTRLFYNAGSPEDGIMISEISDYYAAELESEALHGQSMCEKVPLSEMPAALPQAFIAIEDRRFYEHDGVDLLRTAKAGANYLLHFDSRFGGSTITQQLIKNIGGESETSILRKAKEMLRAWRLEHAHSKEEILEAYLNVVPFGHNCCGVGMAARTFFDKTPAELTTAECASLAAIINSPARYDPVRHPEENRHRRDLVLSVMQEQGYLSEKEAETAMAEPLVTREGKAAEGSVLSWYTETVISDVIRDLETECGYTRQAASELVWNGGLSIYTLQDPAVQKTLEAYFADASHFPAAVRNGLACGMAVADPESGNLLGIVGGIGKKQGNRVLNYAADTRRAPGSALKPLALYAPALEEEILTSATVYDDVPTNFYGSSQNPVPWPRNSPGVYSGLLPVADAVAYSKNTVAVRVYRQLGAEKVYRYLTEKWKFGGIVRQGKDKDGNTVTDLAVSPLALGQLTMGVSVREMTAAYAALAGNGVYHPCRSYALVLDRDGKVLLRQDGTGERAVSAETAELTTQLLLGVTEYGTAREITLQREIDCAGKTGTSGGSRDRWFVGYTPYLCAGVWYGYPEGERGAAGLSPSPAKIWDEVMTRLHRPMLTLPEEREKHFSTAGLTRCRVCRDSGMLLSDACALDPRGDRGVTLWFRRGTEPTACCHRHVPVRYDGEIGGVITDPFDEREGITVSLLDVPWRDFPVQVYVADAEYVFRPLGSAEPGKWWGVPYFVNTVPKGRFVGLTDHDGGRQFNASAYDRLPEAEELPDDADPESEDTAGRQSEPPEEAGGHLLFR